MKIGFLSICTMMFMLYGTDCFARDSVKNMASKWENKAESDEFVSSDNEKYDRRLGEARIKKGNVRDLRKKFGEQDKQEDSSDTEVSEVKKKIKFFESQKDGEDSEVFERRNRKFSRNRTDDDSDVSREFVSKKRKFFEQDGEKRAEGDEREYSKRRKTSQSELEELGNKGFVKRNRENFQSRTDEPSVDEKDVEQQQIEEDVVSQKQVNAKSAKNQRRNARKNKRK